MSLDVLVCNNFCVCMLFLLLWSCDLRSGPCELLLSIAIRLFVLQMTRECLVSSRLRWRYCTIAAALGACCRDLSNVDTRAQLGRCVLGFERGLQWTCTAHAFSQSDAMFGCQVSLYKYGPNRIGIELC